MKKWLADWLTRQHERNHQRLIEEGRRLRMQLEEQGVDIVLTPEQKARLRKKAEGIDPDMPRGLSKVTLTR